jgi:hypothetical protein
VLARDRGERVLDRAVAGALGDLELVAIAPAHEAEVLRQHDEPGAAGGRARDEATRRGDVRLDARRRDHLDRGDLHGGPSFSA